MNLYKTQSTYSRIKVFPNIQGFTHHYKIIPRSQYMRTKQAQAQQNHSNFITQMMIKFLYK